MGDVAGVEHVLAEGADGSLRFRYKGRNALDWAEKRGHVEVATLLRAANREALVPLPEEGEEEEEEEEQGQEGQEEQGEEGQ